MKTSAIEVHDMLSVFSVDEVEQRIGEVPGIQSVTVNFAAGNATVCYDEPQIEATDIKAAVRRVDSIPVRPPPARRAMATKAKRPRVRRLQLHRPQRRQPQRLRRPIPLPLRPASAPQDSTWQPPPRLLRLPRPSRPPLPTQRRPMPPQATNRRTRRQQRNDSAPPRPPAHCRPNHLNAWHRTQPVPKRPTVP